MFITGLTRKGLEEEEMILIPFLILFPLLMAGIMYFIQSSKVRRYVVYVGAGIIACATFALLFWWILQGATTMEFYYETEVADHIILGVELILMCLVTFLSFKYKKGWISVLSIVPTLMLAYFDLFGPQLKTTAHIRLDHLSVLMCLIIGIVGTLICVYAVGYMHGYHQNHTEVEDRRNYFFMLLFLFLGAMYGFVMSESLLWIDLFWEMTSICSFLLIGYTRTEEAINNSFRALWMNLLGGCALAAGIIYFGCTTYNVSLRALVECGRMGFSFAVIPVTLIAFAALTKSAQLPFSTWLIGAMVAPTPSSALLHSATMVKAGIYILFRLAPAMQGNATGTFIAFIGGFTFLITSLMAIAQSDAKKVLAFSTISNLGLMVACAGVGTSTTIWAGIFLMIFHAVSKSLLFQDVGATENAIHSRDIEDMHGLLFRLPVLATIMFIGIAGMFLAPFGMLISKWAALRASVDARQILLVFFIVFGSATTSFYWTKWMGKIISKSHMTGERDRDITKPNERFSLFIHAGLMILLCVLFPLISKLFVEDLLTEMFAVATPVLSQPILYMLVIIICIVFAVPLLSYFFSKNVKTNQKLAYMNGINEGDDSSFVDSLGDPKKLWLSNFYFAEMLGQRKLMIPGQIFSCLVIVIMLCVIIGGVMI